MTKKISENFNPSLKNKWAGRRYYALDVYLKEHFQEKIYRVSLQAGLTCPNRDGYLHTRGCIFCSSKGSGDFAQKKESSITTQLKSGKEQIFKKRNCRKFIAYFQAFSNTYGPIEYLRKIFMEAITDPDVMILSIATRPDCLSPQVIDLLRELNNIKPVWIELGLQSIHTATHRFLRSGFTVEDFEHSLNCLNEVGISVIVHVILGLPGETKDMILDTIQYLAHVRISGIKLQLLHVLSDTDLGALYQLEPFHLLSLGEYCDLIVDCLMELPQNIVIHRLTGDGPKDLLIGPLWSMKKMHVLNQINRRLKERDAFQGKKFKEW